MPPQTPPRGRCFTPTALHDISARNRPARTAELPSSACSTQPDELLPARLETRRPPGDPTLQDTRLDGLRYRSFVQKLAEEVVLQTWDSRVEPPSYAPESSAVKRKTVPLKAAPPGQASTTLPSAVAKASANRARRSG